MVSEYSLSQDPLSSLSMVQAILAARERIDAVVYKFRDPEILSALQEILGRGVHLRLVLDGDKAASAKCLGPDAARLGANLRHWSPRHGKLHAKLMIVDGERAFAGSSNWTVSARSKNQELLLMLDDTESVESMQQLFEKLWAGSETPSR